MVYITVRKPSFEFRKFLTPWWFRSDDVYMYRATTFATLMLVNFYLGTFFSKRKKVCTLYIKKGYLFKNEFVHLTYSWFFVWLKELTCYQFDWGQLRGSFSRHTYNFTYLKFVLIFNTSTPYLHVSEVLSSGFPGFKTSTASTTSVTSTASFHQKIY